MKRLRPSAGWRHLDGPPGHGKAPVWEHPSGMRIHVGGLARYPGGPSITPTYKEERTFRAHQPKKRRWLMVWAEALLKNKQP